MHACVDMTVEGVTMRFVIHFVSVYSIIHPGVQRAANMPGTACDRVRQPLSEIFMRYFSVETEKECPETPEPLNGTPDRDAHSSQVLSWLETQTDLQS